VLEAAGHQVVSTDLIQRDYGAGGIDFLRETEARAKHIVTNPPYGRGLADAFVRHTLTLTSSTGGSVAMLLNLASLCQPTRHRLWVENPPAAIYALDELVCWSEGDPAYAGRFTNRHRYCWVVWTPSHPGRPPDVLVARHFTIPRRHAGAGCASGELAICHHPGLRHNLLILLVPPRGLEPRTPRSTISGLPFSYVLGVSQIRRISYALLVGYPARR
jgi:hypothetical protein